jgi:hypothetical protein
MIRFLFIFFYLFLSLTQSKISSYEINPKHNKLKNITILDTKELDFSNISELSALAYRDEILYALSDKGILYNFAIKIKNKKIKRVALQATFPLKIKGNKRKKIDSEGMVFVKNDLLISFERDPKIMLFNVNGKSKKLESKYKLNKRLKNQKNYVSKNKMLEAVAYSSKYGVISVAERPLKSKKHHVLYGSKKSWRIPYRGDISAIEFMSKHKLLILQRKFNFLTRRRVTILGSLNLKKDRYKVLARLDSSDGWKIDNFEGLTKVKKNIYLMISDDNESFFQKTLLVLFEIKE